MHGATTENDPRSPSRNASSARLSAWVPGSTHTIAPALSATDRSARRPASGNSFSTWLTTSVPTGAVSSTTPPARMHGNPGNSSPARAAAKSSASGDRSWSVSEVNRSAPKAATTRRPAIPLPQPKSSTGPGGGTQRRSLSSRRTASHFQPIRSPKVAS